MAHERSEAEMAKLLARGRMHRPLGSGGGSGGQGGGSGGGSGVAASIGERNRWDAANQIIKRTNEHSASAKDRIGGGGGRGTSPSPSGSRPQTARVGTPTAPNKERPGTSPGHHNNSSSTKSPQRHSLSRPNTARGGAGGRSSVSVVSPLRQEREYIRNQENLPSHIRSTLQMLNSNLSALKRFSNEFRSLSLAEMHAASVRLDSLTKSQDVGLKDLASFTAQEVRYGAERLTDLSLQLHSDILSDGSSGSGAHHHGTERSIPAQGDPGLRSELQTYNVIYTLLNTLCNVVQAEDAVLFLFPRPRHGGVAVTGVNGVAGTNGTREPSPPDRRSQQGATRHGLLEGTKGRFALDPEDGSMKDFAALPPDSDERLLAEVLKEHMPKVKKHEGRSLQLVAHVTSRSFHSLDIGSVPPDIFDLCDSACRSKCAANITSQATGLREQQFNTLVACPIIPCGEAYPIGVVCAVNKIAQYQPVFSPEDEFRLMYAGEQIAELLQRLPLEVSAGASPLVTPSTFQQLWAEWTHQHQAPRERTASAGHHHHDHSPSRKKGTSGDRRKRGSSAHGRHEQEEREREQQQQKPIVVTGTVRPDVREPVPKKFLFRATHNGALLHGLSFRSRLSITPGEVLIDVLTKYQVLQKQLDAAQHRISVLMSKVDDEHKQMQTAKDEARNFERQSSEMQAASERILRMAYLGSRKRRPTVAGTCTSSDGTTTTRTIPLDLAAATSPMATGAATNSGLPSSQRAIAVARSGSGEPLQSDDGVGPMMEDRESSQTDLQQPSPLDRSGRSAGRSQQEEDLRGALSRQERREEEEELESETPVVVDTSALPSHFLKEAAKLRTKSFFPTKPGPWNPKSKAVLGGSLLKK